MVAFLALDGDAAEPDPNAELKTEELIERTRAAGFFVFEADPTEGVQDVIDGLEADTGRIATALREQVRQTQLLEGANRGLVVAHADALAVIEDLQGQVDSLNAQGDPVSVTAQIEDPTFGGWLRFLYETQRFDAELTAEVPFALTMTEAADGRMLFSMVPEDPRVVATVNQGAWTPPPPVHQCTFRQQAKAGAVGGGIVGVIAAIAALAGG